MARRNTQAGEQPTSTVTMHEQRPQARRSTVKKKALEDEGNTHDSRKVQNYATQGLRQRQALDDMINGIDNKLTDSAHHVPPTFTSTYSKTPGTDRTVAPLPSTVIDPQLLADGLDESSHANIPRKYVQQSRFKQSFDTVPHLMGGQVEHHTPTPSRGVPQSLMADGSLSLIESPVAQQPFQLTALGAGKRPAPPRTKVEGLQVVQKVKLGDRGSHGRVRCTDFDDLYSSIIHLAVGHYQAILANSTIYPGDIESNNWSGEAWAVTCHVNGVKIDYDEDMYKLITLRGFNLWSELKNAMQPLVVTEFGFIDGKTPEAVKSNTALAELLLANRKIVDEFVAAAAEWDTHSESDSDDDMM